MNLQKNRFGIYYFRTKIPKDLITQNTRKNIYLSLQTSNIALAEARADKVRGYIDHYFNFLRSNGLYPVRKRLNKTGDIMFNLSASLSFNESEVVIKSSNSTLFNQLLQTITAINNGEKITTESNTNEDDRLVSEVFAEYCKGTGENLSVISLKNRTSVLGYATALFDGKKLNQVNRQTVFDVKKNLGKLPVYLYNKSFYKQKKLLKDLGELPQPYKTINAKSQERIFSILISFFNWCVAKGYKETNPFDKQKIFCEIKEDKVVAYTQEDLEKLFNGKPFEEFTERYSSRYWVTLMSLYTGARRGELVALEVKDIIVNKQGQFFMYINKESSIKNKIKLVKNSHSVRLIPIPNKLMELGFREYYETIKREGYLPLFPDLRIKPNGIVSFDALTNCFFLYKKTLDIKGHKTFHSLRHNAISCLKHKKCLLQEIQQLVGHAYGNITFDVYGEPSDMSDMVELVNKIEFDLDIKPWHDSPAKKHVREMVWKKSKANLKI